MSLELQQSLLNLGSLIDIEWKIGVGISSSYTRSLDTPFITMRIISRLSNGQIQSNTIELR